MLRNHLLRYAIYTLAIVIGMLLAFFAGQAIAKASGAGILTPRKANRSHPALPTGVSQADRRPNPTARPTGYLSAQHQCSNTTPRVECRAALRRALAAADWQRNARAHDVQSVLNRVRGKQPFAYAARIAYAACITFSPDPKRCRPPAEMLSVGRCESGLKIRNPNPLSSADSWMQYLLSTWRSQPIARLGWFSRYDPIAVAIAAESMSRHGWSAWRASIYCHGLS